MARSIDANFQYANWYSEWDWAEIYGRSVTRWASPNDYSGGSTHKQSDMRMTYNPGQNVYHCLSQYEMKKFRAEMGFRAIVLRAHWSWRYGGSDGGSGSFQVYVRSLLKSLGYPDLDDCDLQYKDVGSTIAWYGSGYSPQVGKDVSAQTIAQFTWDQNGLNNGDFLSVMDLTDYFAQQLLDNEDLWFEMVQQSSSSTMWVGTSVMGERPKLDVQYLFPVEMFPLKSDGSGQIDLGRLLNTDDQPINLGAYQLAETGAGIEFKLKNFSRSSIAHIELWDDYPEWTEPAADAGNAGSAALAHVEPFEDCISQRWEIKFLTATTFEVKAEMYLDQVEGLHPQYDADGDWQGAVGGDWTSPGGELVIPTAGWSGTAVADDLFVFHTIGNSTNTGWPADSNDQVQMAVDDGGAPGTWRPITGQRTHLTTADAVDAATITVAVKYIDTTKWIVGGVVFIADSDNIDIGQIKSVTATTVEIESLAVTNNNYAIGAYVATTLPFRSLVASPWAQLTAASGVSQSEEDRLYIENADEYGFTQSNIVTIQSLDDPTLEETITIQGIQSGYLDLSVDMTNDYEVGAVVAEIETGEISFWLRVVADPGTLEERKEFRLAVIA